MRGYFVTLAVSITYFSKCLPTRHGCTSQTYIMCKFFVLIKYVCHVLLLNNVKW